MFVRAYLRASTIDQDASRARASLESFAEEHRGDRRVDHVGIALLERVEVRLLVGDRQDVARHGQLLCRRQPLVKFPGGEIHPLQIALADQPELVNQDPYGEGWLIKIKPAADADFDSLLDAEAYKALINE